MASPFEYGNFQFQLFNSTPLIPPSAEYSDILRRSSTAIGSFGDQQFSPSPLASQVSTSSYVRSSSSAATTPSPPLIVKNIPSMTITEDVVSPNYMIPTNGVGVVVWISATSGLLCQVGTKSYQQRHPTSPSSSPTIDNCLISFDIKSFCDQAVPDLTNVLRVGFIVKYLLSGATVSSPVLTPINGQFPPRLAADYVSPLRLDDWNMNSVELAAEATKLASQLDTPSAEPLPYKDSNHRKIQYDLEMEIKATQLLMGIFRDRLAAEGPQCQLTNVHCIVSNCGDEQLYRYIGTSSQKRRDYIERRAHFFTLTSDDMVCLVPAAVHGAVSALTRELLKRGGSMTLQELFDQYLNWPDLPLESREIVGETPAAFLSFLEAHQFIFSIFPSRIFLSLRRRLPDFDYGSFLEEAFGDQEGSPYFSQRFQETDVVPARGTETTTDFRGLPLASRWPSAAGSLPEATSPMSGVLPPATHFTMDQQAYGGSHVSGTSMHARPSVAGNIGCLMQDEINVGSSAQYLAYGGGAGIGDRSLSSSGYSTDPTSSFSMLSSNWLAAPALNGQESVWKSYEVGTENLIRQLHSAKLTDQNSQSVVNNDCVTSISSSTIELAKTIKTPASSGGGKSVNECGIQTEHLCAITLRCGSCGVMNKLKTTANDYQWKLVREMTDASCQTADLP